MLRLCRRSMAFTVPAHLREAFRTPTHAGRCMIVGAPFWRYPFAVVPPEPETAPLIAAVRALDETMRPFRIVSHVDTDGCVFNASFFESEDTMQKFLSWYSANALEPGSQHHSAPAQHHSKITPNQITPRLSPVPMPDHCLTAPSSCAAACLTSAAAAPAVLPTASSLLFGKGTEVLADTRFGEYQLGMAVRYSRQVLHSEAMEAEARVGAATAEFEERIAARMQEAGVAYFGRLIMQAPGSGEFITAVRYGSLEDARKGTQAVEALMAPELERWFSSRTSLIGTATRVLEL